VKPSRRRGELNRLPGRLVAYAVETADTPLGSGLPPSVAVAAVDILVTTRIEDENVRHRIAAA
jgi:hydrogenase maturation protease